MDLDRSLKHALDRIAACVLLVLLAPLFAFIAVAIRLDTPGSPFFLQERIGAGGRPFTIFKFRSMREGSERHGLGDTTSAEDQRITRVGRRLRAASLDELPQLINIALGEMSFVGPRPTLRPQVERYTPQQRRRLLFRPGITGWAQVHGRNEIPWEQRIELDVHYIDHYSVRLDLEILLRTLGVLLRRDGVYARGRTNDAFLPDAAAAEPARPLPAPGPSGRAPAAPAPQVAARGPAEAAQGSPAGPAPAPLLPLLVVGAGGHARVILDIAEKQARYRVVGLLDEQPGAAGTTLMGYPVLGGREVLERADLPAHAFVAIGAPRSREAWQAHLEDLGFQMAVLAHPSAQVGREASLGPGTALMAGAIVNSGSRLGRGVVVNTGASVDHDCEVGDFVHVAPGAHLAGGVHVGPRAHVGIGSCVLQNLCIGADAVVGGGAAVAGSVTAGVTVVGVPARPLPAAKPATPAAAARA